MKNLFKPLTALGSAALLSLGLAAHAQEQKPITIGVLTDLSGVFSDETGEGSVVAAQIAIDAFGGAVKGRPIRFLTADHQHNPEVGSNIARQWIDQEQVDLILDVPNSSVLLAVQEVVRTSPHTLLIASGGQTGAFANEACSPYGFQWTTNSFATSSGLAGLAEAPDAKKWFFIQADYAYGDSVTKDLSAAVQGQGGEVVGLVKHPLNNNDFASYILQAQASNADVVALISSGADLANVLKQAAEFGVTQKLATTNLFVTTVKSVGLDLVKGLIVSDAWYWNATLETAEWSAEFRKRHSKSQAPTAVQIGVYSAVNHFLKSVDAASGTDRDSILEMFRTTPVNDVFVQDGKVREDGLMAHDMVILQARTPEDLIGGDDWDVFTILQTIPGDQVYEDLSRSRCPLLRKG